MAHQVLSRKYRPQSFDEMVGQQHVARILRGALASDRVGHAYLFVGPRGVGKTTTARIFAKALNCAGEGREGRDPCGTCASCRDITAGNDLDVVEMDAASNNHVEDVRRLREQVGYATVRSRHRIWIVDEVHMLSMPAFNAFLKTLEEPPEGVKFIFCTTEEHKLPDTFRSRCQRVEFKPIDEASMAARLTDLAAREGAELEDGLAEEMARAALGGLRDAESLLEQLIAASESARIRRADLDALAGRAPADRLRALTGAVDDGDAAAALDALDACLAAGSKPGVLLDQWMDALRRGLLAAASGGGGVATLARALDVLLEKRVHLRGGADGTLVLQVAAVELAKLPAARDLDRLIAALEAAPRGGRAAPAAPEGPTASSAPARPAAAPARADLDGVRQRWSDLVAAAKTRDPRFAAALSRARPAALADGRVRVAVGAGDGLARAGLERREAVLTFRAVTERVLGQALALVVEAVDDAPEATPPAPPIQEAEGIRRVTEATGGRLLNVEPRSPAARDPEP